MKSAERSPDTGTTRRKLALPRWFLLLLSVTVWPLLIFLFHALLPWAIAGMAGRFGWADRTPGFWNWPGLACVGLGTMVVLWFWVVHMKKAIAPERLEFQFTPAYLITDGPYRYSRNPMYVAVLTIWVGWAVLYGSWPVLGVTFLWWLLLNFLIIPREERGLEARHQERFREYAKNVPRWF